MVEYLEGRVAALEEENRVLKELLLIYGEHSQALFDLTTKIFGTLDQNPTESADKESDDDSN